MYLIVLKGLAGSGKSTLGRCLSQQLNWPLIDKDDIKDILDGRTADAGGLAYEVMFRIVRRQLLQGLNVICDSPLSFESLYNKVQELAYETGASLVIIECVCSDVALWQKRIDSRKTLNLPAHHQTDWETFNAQRSAMQANANYSITSAYLRLDTTRPLNELVAHVINWLERTTPE